MVQGGSNSAAGVREGDILAGKYRVERVLGIGGMGVVVAAHHIQLDTKVAIKFLLPELLGNQDAAARFMREARNAVRITSEHVARVSDVGTLENGAPYMVMEFLDGVDLSGWLRQRGSLPFEEAVDFVLQAGEAIAEAHALGIVHRDLKPANLFCIRSADGRLTIKVLDFGISKATSLSASASNLIKTQTAALMGSPFYMSPEQMVAIQTVDFRTDVWALGVILFELLTGKVPFPGETVPEVSSKIAAHAPPPLRDFRPDAPPGLEATIFRCLEKDRERRYRNVAELALGLLPFGPKRAKASVEKIAAIIQAAGLSATALSVPPSPGPTSQPTSSETIAPVGRTASGTKGGKARVGMFAAVGVVAVVGGVAVLRHSFTDAKMTDAGPSVNPLLAVDAAPDECAARSARCNGSTPQTCSAQGKWQSGQVCPYACSKGWCAGVCVPNARQCSGAVPQACNGDGQWVSGSVTAGECGVACTPGSSPPQCVGNTPQICASTGQWQNGVPCNASSCREGVCNRSGATPPPSPRHDAAPSPTMTTTAAAEAIAPQTKPDCEPNYTIDPISGAHLFKPQCFPK